MSNGVPPGPWSPSHLKKLREEHLGRLSESMQAQPGAFQQGGGILFNRSELRSTPIELRAMAAAP